jgi:hypothetical protein
MAPASHGDITDRCHRRTVALQLSSSISAFTPKAGLLDATEWGLWITGQCINEHATSDDLRRNNAAVLRIR